MRPHITCHMISSIDGRLIADRWTPIHGNSRKDLVLSVYEAAAARLGAQGWIVGRRTMEGMAQGARRPLDGAIRRDTHRAHVGEHHGRPLAVVIDPKGSLFHAGNTLGSEHVVAVLGESVPDPYLEHLREQGVSFVFAGADGTGLAAAMEALAEHFGVTSLLLEGGGITNGAFLKADLIDAISLLMYPGIDGLGAIPSIFEAQGETPEDRPAQGRSLSLQSVEALDGGIVWLRYAVHRSSGP